MKFNEYKYQRPNIDEVKSNFEILIKEFNAASSAQQQENLIEKIIKIQNDVETMFSIAMVRHSINVADEFYDKENDYIDEANPVFQGITVEYYKALINSKFRSKLENKFGKQLFTLAEMNIKTFSDEVLPDLQEENKLSSQYDKLIASAKLNFKGEIRNLSQMGPFMQSKDRQIRKEANAKYYSFFSENEAKFDEIYDKLVKVRTTIAKKLGFKNFVELGYLRMDRSEYGPKDVKCYRDQVKKYVVPVTEELKRRQANRLGIKDFKFYDAPISSNKGNAMPKGDKDWMVDKAKKMYCELSPETNEFFKFMTDSELLDLETKKNKQSGGYCTGFPNFKAPFIFSNFNGTSADVNVLTHEAGHAFQAYESRDIEIPEYGSPTLEACEIHSMSMEFITWPWMNLFFEEQADKYKFEHLADSLVFIPYGVTVDEFQHFVYENPEATPTERKAKWREIEKAYLPSLDYDNNDFLERGGRWFKQGHIFQVPFYYIDYTLAQVCAFQYWIKFNENRETAWQDYLRLCKAGGSKPFLQLLNVGNLESPFKNGTLEKIVPHIKQWLDSVDDSII
ncbi:M3 family oligoendopeptidase [Sedimentibacter sp. zth1]|uniref:M3 family oligoendopeptidase n=1 Tax=Sedimentibacter sp. zth1 TaxID=2816908 RepID=UPI001A90DE33|nr:M3 family oligoendopeptidase [Sedimentibacter sp. zth1]QSX06888.1 M3 family oligoendopeptidase [Sedimentibacter sp. zth1]